MVKHWVYIAIGFWIMISPWLLGFAEISIAKWSNVILGLVLVIMSSGIVFTESVPGKIEGKK